jgi:hypothetical protein
MTDFDTRWNKSTHLWEVDKQNKTITKIGNDKCWNTYEQVKYRFGLYMSLKEAKTAIRKASKPFAYDDNPAPKLEEFKIIS